MPHQNILKPRFYPVKNLEIATCLDLYAKYKYTSSQNEIIENDDEIDLELYKAASFNPYIEHRIPLIKDDLGKMELTFNTGQFTSTNPATVAGSSSLGFNYFAMLGHGLDSAGCGFKIYGVQMVDGNGSESYSTSEIDMTPILNCTTVQDTNGEDWIIPTRGGSSWEADEITGQLGDDLDISGAGAGDSTGDYANGTLIIEIDPDTTDMYHSRFFKVVFKPFTSVGFGQDYLSIGSFAWGRYYDMPHSPDLSYSISISNEGVKSKKTVGGSTITNIGWDRRPGIGGVYEGFGREWSKDGTTIPSGRRSWKMNFSAIKSDWTGGYNDETGYLFPGTTHSNTEWRYGNDFLFRVMNPTLGGQLPFIWEYDVTTLEEDNSISQWAVGQHNEDHFAIARFKKNSISFQHKSHKFFDVSLNIEESW